MAQLGLDGSADTALDFRPAGEEPPGPTGVHTIPCHSQLLSLWSPVLRDVLSGGAASSSELEPAGASSDERTTSSGSSGIRYRIPMPPDDDPDAWQTILALILPPHTVPSPAITWVGERY